MKKFSSFPAALILLPMILVLVSCKKSEKVPDYPQLIGTWGGNTSQESPVSFYVDDIKGTLYIESYNLSVYTNTGVQTYQNINGKGITSISNTSFHISLGTGSAGPAYIDGTFNLSDMSLSGNFAVYATGNSVDITTGTYLANK